MIRLGGKSIGRIMSASGAWANTKEDMNLLVKDWKFQTIVSKTCTLKPRDGNALPNFVNLPRERISLNCMGMPNHGYEYYKKLLPYYENRGVGYIISIDGSNSEDCIDMLLDYSNAEGAVYKIAEINLSCPNTSLSIPSYSISCIEALLKKMRVFDWNKMAIGLKLSPIIDYKMLVEIATIINKMSVRKSIITHLVCSNSIPNGMILDSNHRPILSSGFGGISGLPAKILALGNVYNLRKLLEPNIQIIGCGGIEKWSDIQDYISCGASGVQIGRAIYTKSLKMDILEIE